ncbi:MAG: hypothetical protein WBC60_17125 [Cognaticolwellia sp.]
MVPDTKLLLKQINDISRQLLSDILSVEKEIKEGSSSNNQNNNNQTSASASRDNNLNQSDVTKEHNIGKLTDQRQQLIRFLFEQKTKDEISAELKLLNEMVSIDAQITEQSVTCKKSLTEQLIRFKKSKDIKKSYQKL